MEDISHKILFTEKKLDMSKILVVEDEPNVRKLVAINLIKRGYDVLEADTGQKALKYLYDKQANLIILDIKLPDISGLDVLDEFTGNLDISEDCRVIIMTASPIDQSVILNQYPCVSEILIKPFDIDKLIKSVQNALS